MVVKVIRGGKFSKTGHLVCSECDCYFSFSGFDLRVEVSAYIDDRYFIKCPECKEEHEVELSILKD